MRDWKEIAIITILMSIMLYGVARFVLWAIPDPATTPCEHYASYEIRYVPARCFSQLTK